MGGEGEREGRILRSGIWTKGSPRLQLCLESNAQTWWVEWAKSERYASKKGRWGHNHRDKRAKMVDRGETNEGTQHRRVEGRMDIEAALKQRGCVAIVQ